jgi:ATP-dependent DNA helicase HFM1/MER3
MQIALVLIDEVHLLSESRGSCLEAGVVSRIKLVACKPEMAGQPISNVRFIAVSATVPNAGDLAEWLGAPAQNVKIFGDEMRPVKLTTTVKGYQKTTNDFLFDRRLTDNIWQVIADFNRGRPALVFCSSRNGTASTAAHISREASRAAGGSRPSVLLRDPGHYNRLSQAAANVSDSQLRDCIVSGVGFHNAAVTPEDRAIVESLFRAGDLLVLCTTSTLAVGVNLPAYLVVIKGTRRYAGSESSDPSGYEEYDRSTVLQMIGRAGRPQFDTEGASVIMTQRDNTARYQQLVNSAESVESTLHLSLPEYLNAEIALGTITDLAAAIVWLKSTFLYVRVRREPEKYGIPPNIIRGGIKALERWLREELIMKTVRELSTHGLVRTDDEGYSLEALQPGAIMAEHYVKLSTMIELCKCPIGGGVPQLLWVIARSSELSSIKLRRNEKKVLNVVNKSDALRHHVMSEARPDRVVDRISTSADKLFILINYLMADTPPPEKLEYSLKQDAERAVSVGARLSRAMVKYFLHEQRAAEAFNALLLQKSLKNRLWSGSIFETRQITGIGPVIAERLSAAGILSLKQVLDLDLRRFETLAQKTYPWGSGIQASLRRCLPPELELTCTPVAWTSDGCVELKITLSRDNSTAGGQDNAGSSGRRCPGRLLVGSLHDNALLATRSLCLSTFNSPLELKVKTKTCAGRAALQVVASVLSETFVGVDVSNRLFF